MEQVIAALFDRYPQVGLPIVKGAKGTDALKNAVALGLPVPEPVENFVGDARDSFTSVYTPGGEAENLYLYRREDFENPLRVQEVSRPAAQGGSLI